MLAAFSRYIAIQLLAYGLDMGTFLLATVVFGWSPLPANVLAKILAGAFAFYSHRRLTFQVHNQADGRSQFVRYLLLLALNIPLSSVALWLFLPWITSQPLAKFVADAACIGITFFLSRHFVFIAANAGRKPS